MINDTEENINPPRLTDSPLDVQEKPSIMKLDLKNKRSPYSNNDNSVLNPDDVLKFSVKRDEKKTEELSTKEITKGLEKQTNKTIDKVENKGKENEILKKTHVERDDQRNKECAIETTKQEVEIGTKQNELKDQNGKGKF